LLRGNLNTEKKGVKPTNCVDARGGNEGGESISWADAKKRGPRRRKTQRGKGGTALPPMVHSL